jgi:hypothetical protein
MVADLAGGQLLPQSCPKAAPKADWLAEKEEALILFTTVQSARPFDFQLQSLVLEYIIQMAKCWSQNEFFEEES